MNSFDPTLLKNAFSAYITGITVVTTYDSLNKPRGFTANSFTSVSLDPPLLMVCPSINLPCLDAFQHTQRFAINILSSTQETISNTFASPIEKRFDTISWQDSPNGNPIIDNVSAWFDCSIEKMIKAGDHYIMLGRINTFHDFNKTGLGYSRGKYFKPN